MSNITQDEFTILILDDEPNMVNAIRRELGASSTGRYRYVVEGFSDPRQALDRAQEQEFAAVIVDYRMPEMNGLDFLKALYKTQPDCARIVLSGETDRATLVKMINETHICRFIPKPWDSYTLKNALNQSINYSQALVRNKKMADTLRSNGVAIPSAAAEVVQILVVDDEIDICRALSRDLNNRSHLGEVFAALCAEAGHACIEKLGDTLINVQFSTSPTRGLHMADSIDFACVIADYNMPEMNGVEFLQTFAVMRPDCTLFLLSGIAGIEEIGSALDLAHIYGHIAKPWDGHALRVSIAQALAERKLKIENKLLASLCQAHDMDCTSG